MCLCETVAHIWSGRLRGMELLPGSRSQCCPGLLLGWCSLLRAVHLAHWHALHCCSLSHCLHGQYIRVFFKSCSFGIQMTLHVRSCLCPCCLQSEGLGQVREKGTPLLSMQQEYLVWQYLFEALEGETHSRRMTPRGSSSHAGPCSGLYCCEDCSLLRPQIRRQTGRNWL